MLRQKFSKYCQQFFPTEKYFFLVSMGKSSARAGVFCRPAAEFSHRKCIFRFLWENLPGRPCLLAGLPDFFPTEKCFWTFLWEIFLHRQVISAGRQRSFPIENVFLGFCGIILQARLLFYGFPELLFPQKITFHIFYGKIYCQNRPFV